MSGNNGWRLLLSVFAIGLAVYFVATQSPQLGLDLKGGTQVVLDLQPRPGQTLNSDVANRTLEVLRRRVDSLGVAEPNLEVAGNKRIIVELPGVSDPTEAVNVIGSTAQLTFHPVLANAGQSPPTTAVAVPTSTPPSPSTTASGLGANTTTGARSVLGQEATSSSTTAETSATTTTPTTTTPTEQDQSGPLTIADDSGQMLQLGPSALDGSGVGTATANPPDQNNSQWYISIEFKGNGSSAWQKLTGQAACNQSGDPKRQVAIVLDNKVISHPEVQAGGSNPVQCNSGISGGNTIITGNFTQSEASNLALLIRGGALPVDVKVASQQVVGPELGKAAIDDSKKAVAIGGATTILFILLYYRLLGLVAAVALGAYAAIAYSTLIALNLTLTLPGIAGFVLAIAMAMDSNILVYERVKEEFARGRSMRSAAQLGFKNALSAIIDSNATTFIAAGTLFFLAVGEVKGFGITLLVGTAVSIFVTLVILRTLVQGLLSMEWTRKRPRLLGMYVGAKFRQRMSENPPDIIGISKYFLIASGLVVVIGLTGIAFKGINYGIEFTGGRLIEYSSKTEIPIDKAREEMGKLGYPRAVVQRSGTSDVSVRVPDLKPDQLKQLDESMKRLGGGEATKLRDETVGPSFSQELKHKAVLGLIIGIGLQLAWVAYRFRWTFGIGAVLAMVHDTLLVLGLFTWLQKPFDSVFLASLLTVIAFSVNDTVVVFDRIREQRRRRASEPFSRVVSDACAQTLPRTVNLSLSAIFILLALLFLGGQTLGDFALAILVGIVTGVYSSVMVASPLAVVLERWKPGITARPTTINKRTAPSRAIKVEETEGAEKAESGEGERTQTSASHPKSRPAPRPRKKSSKSKKRR